MKRFVYDAGALIAMEAQSSPMYRIHRQARRVGPPFVPGPALSQAWRGGRRSVQIARLLKDCETVTNFPLDIYFEAGEVLGKVQLAKKKKPDVVDALVAIFAGQHRAAAIVTSDPGDIGAYVEALGLRIEIIPV